MQPWSARRSTLRRPRAAACQILQSASGESIKSVEATMVEESNTEEKKLEIVPLNVDKSLIAELRRELSDLKRTVREVAARVETLPQHEPRMKAR